MNRTALFISAALTVFVLIGVGAIALSLRAPQMAASPTAGAPPTQAVSEPQVTATLDPQLEKIWMEREAVYQQRITEANSRLDKLQKQLTTQSLNQAAGQTIVDLTIPITADQAAAIAANYLGQTSVYSVGVIAISGADVYEVVFYSGDSVYVGMDGQVVGSAPAPVYGSGGGVGGRWNTASGSEGGEHEGGEHEDD